MRHWMELADIALRSDRYASAPLPEDKFEPEGEEKAA
jgi:hypothetical protein